MEKLMKLNGWQRLWVVASGIWVILVAVSAYTSWPQRYVSLDPNAGIPIGADTRLLTDGVLSWTETLTKAEFAKRVKARYPEYRDLTDEVLVDRVLSKFPYYGQFLSDDASGRSDRQAVDELNSERRRQAATKGLLVATLPPLCVYSLGLAFGWMRLIRSGGHVPKGGYDVPNGKRKQWPASAPAVL